MTAPTARRTIRTALAAVAVAVVAVACLTPVGGTASASGSKRDAGTQSDSVSTDDVVSATKEWRVPSRTKEW